VLTILHASDLQCGRPYSRRAAEALVRLAHAMDPDVVVVAGDLTQRAKAREFRLAAELMGRLPDVPTVVTPGNHDVPLYRVWERAFVPYRNWRRHVAAELDTVTRIEGGMFVALNSSAPRRAIVGGRIDSWQLDLARESFATTAPGDVRGLVIHHHFSPTPDGTGGRPLPGAADLLRAFEAMRVDIVLGGHVHRTLVRTSRDLVSGSTGGIPLVACGTTTSRRGRGPEHGINSLNVVRVGSREVEVLPYLLREEAEDFEPTDPIVLARSRGTQVAAEGRTP
jgi:3',5'-cyclic AMP phosphodiesterase CpdA